jgi:hypothetical protein
MEVLQTSALPLGYVAVYQTFVARILPVKAKHFQE